MNNAELIQKLLENLAQQYGIDITDENFKDTPARVAKAYAELLSGYKADTDAILKTGFPSGQYDQMVVVKDIEYQSLCAHHMLPFHGKIAVGYIPNANGKVIGLSKIPRVCHAFARRFQIQERMTNEIAVAIFNAINPIGLGVVVYDSRHLCMSMRGVRAHGDTVTSSLHGLFKDDKSVKDEFFKLVFGI